MLPWTVPRTRTGLCAALVALCGVLAAAEEEEAVKEDAREPTRPPSPSGPSFIFVVTSHERYETSYDGDEARAYRENSFAGEKILCDSRPCVRFTRHYTAATGTTPARGTLMTGMYARVHQAMQTTRLKHGDDEDIRWLDDSIATMGDYFRIAGYDTAYIGEWHLSPERLAEDIAQSVGLNESRKGDKLDKYGFSTWINPDIQSPMMSDVGLSKDDLVVDLSTQWLEDRAKRQEKKPFLLVINLDSPGQIQHWPTVYKYFNLGRAGLQGGPSEQVPIPGLPPSFNEDLSAKSSTTKQARRMVESTFQPMPHSMHRWRGYAQAYMLFQKDADDLLARLAKTVESTFPSGVIVRTSDHGEMGGAHGGVRGQWYNGYEESIRVPLIISGPPVAAQRGSWDDLSSSVDVLPTMLAMAKADLKEIESKVFSSKQGIALPGRNLLMRVPEKEQAAYFETYDHVTRHQRTFVHVAPNLGEWLQEVPVLRNYLASEELDAPTHIEAVVAKPGGDTMAGLPGRGGKVWKLIRFWDEPQAWSAPDVSHTARRGQQNGRFWRVRTRTKPHAEELELYDLERDPMELDNLANKKDYRAVMVSMESMLNVSRPASRALPARSNLQAELGTMSLPQHKVDHVTGTVSSLLYLSMRIEREHPYGSLKILAALLVCFRLLGPYRLAKRLLARVAFPINLVFGASHTMIGVALIQHHALVFPPFLPLLPDAMAHEHPQVYRILGVFTTLCGLTRLAYVLLGTSRGASTLLVSMSWIAESAVLFLLFVSTPTFDILDHLLPLALPAVAIASTQCLGVVHGFSWRMLFARFFAIVLVVAVLIYAGLMYLSMNHARIMVASARLDASAVALAQLSTIIRDAGASEIIGISWQQVLSLTSTIDLPKYIDDLKKLLR